jgi:hypothetical protein
VEHLDSGKFVQHSEALEGNLTCGFLQRCEFFRGALF